MAPCLGLGMREISGGQESPLFEAARTATLDRVTVVVQQLPAVHEAFQPFLPTQPSAYWSKLDDQQDVAAWLGESTQPTSIREFLHRAEKKTHSTSNHHRDTPER